MTDHELAELVEFSEARAYLSFMSATSPDLAERYGFRTATVGSALIVMADSVTTSVNLNRVIGLGIAEPATDEMLDAICSAYARTGVPFGVELSPVGKPDDLADRLRGRGLRRTFFSRILFRDGSPPLGMYNAWTKSTGLRIEGTTDPEQIMALAKLSCQNFRMPEPVASLLAATRRELGWRHWVAFDGDQPVGGSLSYVEAGVCWLGWTSVLPDYRGRWVNAAIVAKELDDAHEAGCRWVTTETASGTNENPDAAHYTLKNFGFREVYLRPTYIGRSRSSR